MEKLFDTLRTPRRAISWLLATLMVVSTFWYGGITGVNAQENDEAPEASVGEATEAGDAGEQGEQIEAPETQEQEEEETLPEVEVPENEEGITAADTDPAIAEGLVYNGAAQQLLSGPASYPEDAPTTGTRALVYSLNPISSSSYSTSYPTASNTGKYTVHYGYRHRASNRDPYTYHEVGTVEAEIGKRDITKVYNQGISGSPYTYTGSAITPTLSLRETRNQGGWSAAARDLTADTDYRIESGVTSAQNIDDYQFTITGIGNYTGSLTFDWSIAANTYRYYTNILTAYDIRVQNYSGTYDGEEHGLTITLQNRAADAKMDFLVSEDGEKYDKEAEEWDGEDVITEAPTFKDAGVYTISYKVYTTVKDNEGNPVYTPYFGTATVTINKKSASVLVNDITKVYDGEPFDLDTEVVVTDIQGLVEGDTLDEIEVGLPEEALESADVGSYKIVITNEDDLPELYPNYNITVNNSATATITPRPITISVDTGEAGEYRKTYSETAVAIGLVYEEYDEEAGTGLVPDDEIKGDALIFNSPTARRDNTNKVTDNQSLAAGTYYIDQYSTNNAGNPVAGILPSANPNYDITFEGAEYVVDKKNIKDEEIKVFFDGKEANVYGYTGNTVKPNVVLHDYQMERDVIKASDYSVTGNVSASAFGTYEISIEATSTGNYYGKRDAVWVIAPYISQSKVYNQAKQMLDDDYIKRALADFSIKAIRYSTTEVEEEVTEENFEELYAYDKDQITEALNAIDVGDYTVFYAFLVGDKYIKGQAVLTITPYSVEVEVPDVGNVKKYDGSAQFVFKNKIEKVTDFGDTIEISNLIGEFEVADSNYALDKTEEELRDITFSTANLKKATITGENAENYIPKVKSSTKGIIERKVLPVDAFEVTVADKEYDGLIVNKDVSITCDEAALVKGESITFKEDNVLGLFFGGEEPQSVLIVDGQVEAKDIVVIGLATAGNDATNVENYIFPMAPEPDEIEPEQGEDPLIGEEEIDTYAIATFIDKAKILPREVTITPSSGTKTYDGKAVTTESAGLTFTIEGIDEELAKVDQLAAAILKDPDAHFMVSFEKGVEVKNAGEYVVYSSGNDGLDKETNFDFKTMTGAYTITPKAVTVKVEDATKKAGEDDPVFKYSVTGLVSGDSLKNIKVTRVAGEDVGTYKVSATCDADKNYAITFVDGTFTITEGEAPATNYQNEWVDGQWYDANGNASYEPKGSWKQNDTGWWYEDESGWYPVSDWQKIDGLWYYFKHDGYMAASEWIDGWWCDADGSCTYEGRGSWQQDSTGWWYGDTLGWYAVSSWQKIDSVWYYFGSDGYLATSQYIDGYWVNADGAWAE